MPQDFYELDYYQKTIKNEFSFSSNTVRDSKPPDKSFIKKINSKYGSQFARCRLLMLSIKKSRTC